jgi:virulence-associated protein VagC
MEETADVVETAVGQMILLPEPFRFTTDRVGIRRQGNAVLLEPVKSTTWPDEFFCAIRIDDPAFVRPEQGPMPPLPS